MAQLETKINFNVDVHLITNRRKSFNADDSII